MRGLKVDSRTAGVTVLHMASEFFLISPMSSFMSIRLKTARHAKYRDRMLGLQSTSFFKRCRLSAKMTSSASSGLFTENKTVERSLAMVRDSAIQLQPLDQSIAHRQEVSPEHSRYHNIHRANRFIYVFQRGYYSARAQDCPLGM